MTSPLLSPSPRSLRRLLWGLALCLTTITLTQLWTAVGSLYVADIIPRESPTVQSMFYYAIRLITPLTTILSLLGYWLLATPLTPTPRTRGANLILWYLRGHTLVLLGWHGWVAALGAYYSRLPHENSEPVGVLYIACSRLSNYLVLSAAIFAVWACLWRLGDLAHSLPTLKPRPRLWHLRYVPLLCTTALPLLHLLPMLTDGIKLPGREAPWGGYFYYYFPHYDNYLTALSYLGNLTLALLYVLFCYHLLNILYANPHPNRRKPAPTSS